ncbi:MAG: glycine zipper domain-containing protein [Myxococcota bacterium]
MTRLRCVAAFGLALSLAAPVAADDAYVYPAKGQSADQTEKDKMACYEWAKKQTGFDPMERPTATSAPPEQKGGALRGAAGGALIGVAAGAIAGDAGTGAAIGAASGGLLGGMRRQQSRREQDQWAQNQSAQYNQRRGEYDRAWSACLEGKGYTVK